MLCVIHGPRIIGLRLLIHRIRAESDPETGGNHAARRDGLDFLYKLPMPQAGGSATGRTHRLPRADPPIFHPKEYSTLCCSAEFPAHASPSLPLPHQHAADDVHPPGASPGVEQLLLQQQLVGLRRRRRRNAAPTGARRGAAVVDGGRRGAAPREAHAKARRHRLIPRGTYAFSSQLDRSIRQFAVCAQRTDTDLGVLVS